MTAAKRVSPPISRSSYEGHYHDLLNDFAEMLAVEDQRGAACDTRTRAPRALIVSDDVKEHSGQLMRKNDSLQPGNVLTVSYVIKINYE